MNLDVIALPRTALTQAMRSRTGRRRGVRPNIRKTACVAPISSEWDIIFLEGSRFSWLSLWLQLLPAAHSASFCMSAFHTQASRSFCARYGNQPAGGILS
jgi:hypothetical protein